MTSWLERIRQREMIRNSAVAVARLLAQMQILEQSALDIGAVAAGLDLDAVVASTDQSASGFAEARDHLITAAMMLGWADLRREEQGDDVASITGEALVEIAAAERCFKTSAFRLPELKLNAQFDQHNTA